jgi:hypothetical protein
MILSMAVVNMMFQFSLGFLSALAISVAVLLKIMSQLSRLCASRTYVARTAILILYLFSPTIRTDGFRLMEDVVSCHPTDLALQLLFVIQF